VSWGGGGGCECVLVERPRHESKISREKNIPVEGIRGLKSVGVGERKNMWGWRGKNKGKGGGGSQKKVDRKATTGEKTVEGKSERNGRDIT